MISEQDLKEIKNRDFLLNTNHYRNFDDIKTKYIFGNIVENAFLTIIVPVYDHPVQLMKRAINSVLNQKCNYSIQLLVIDDFASRKEPSEFEIYLRTINDPRIVYYKNEQNLGVFANWNRAIEISKTEWITILHTDDFYKDNFLQTMKDVIDLHPEIDQLACKYKLINLLESTYDISNEYSGNTGKASVYKVSYLDYLYEMYTSVKGSFYKRNLLMEIGGFRSQGDGLGLDDYPLMLRFAYYYNTYLIDEVMYVNSWGYNDSMNVKHWYPELIANYYLQMYFAKQETGLLRFIFEKRAEFLLSLRAKEFNEGTSWVGIPVNIDFDELKKCCDLQSFKFNPIFNKLLCYVTRKIIENKKGNIPSFNIVIRDCSTEYRLE